MPDAPSERQRWAIAFATQALADLDTRDLLARADGQPYAHLHFLQMAAEKLCKAYLVDENGFENMQYSHCILQKQLPRILANVLQHGDWASSRRRAHLSGLKSLIREIELLSPSCDEQGSRPDNCEYPWIDSTGLVRNPCTHPFLIDDHDRRFINLLKLLRRAAEDFESSSSNKNRPQTDK